MTTKRRKRRKSCKHGKLKRPVRTKKGGKRMCRKRKSRNRKSYKMQNNPSTKLEDMPTEMLLRVFENSSLDELANLYATNYQLRDIAIDIVRRRLSNDDKSYEMILESYDNRINVVRLLLDTGADINAQDTDGNTALTNASHRGNIEIVRLLLDRGADVNIKDEDDVTALWYAIASIRK